jgi:RNA polymerase sigma factor for flagellar operon FliA
VSDAHIRSGLALLVRPGRAEAALWRRLRFEEEHECRELLFERYSGLARTIAARHFYRRSRKTIERADFEQFAYQGLLQAIDRYDPLTGVPFSAFARRRIAGSIADGVGKMSEDAAQISHRARIEQERLRSLRRRGEGADAADGGDALAELTELALGLALGLMLEGTSLAGTPGSGADTRADAYESLAWRELQTQLAGAVAALPEREAAVLRHHYEHGLSFAQVAELLDLSRGRVSQLHKAALDRLRKKLGTFG